MSPSQHILSALLAGIALLTSAGCLSLGSTTYELDSPKLNAQMQALETRVALLERAVVGAPTNGASGQAVATNYYGPIKIDSSAQPAANQPR